MTDPLPTQKIGPALAAAAAEAFGGPAARPPQAPALPAGNADARVAFEKIMRQQQQVVEPEPLGNSIFDAPGNSAARAAKVARVRETLAGLARQILAAASELEADLTALVKDATAVKAAETFDAKLAAKFLAELKGVVTGVVPKAESKPAE